MGSKARIAKYILPIMLANKRPNQWWVEPFVGGGNIIDKVGGKRIGADADRWVIEALLAIRDNVHQLPKNNSEFTEDDYKQLRKSDEYRFKGYAGFAFSYGSKWLGGWRRDTAGKRDYVQEAFDNAVMQSPRLQGVLLVNTDFTSLGIPPQSLIYCDPPYADATRYKVDFDHSAFWQWCRKKAEEGHTIFISEYTAPSDFECIWQKEIVSSLTKDTGSKTGVEKLFVPRKQNLSSSYQVFAQRSIFEMVQERTNDGI